MPLDITLNLPQLLALIATTASIPILEETIASEEGRGGGKKKPRSKVIEACRQTIAILGRSFLPPPPAKHWDDRTLYLGDFLEPSVQAVYDLSANFRHDIKNTKYKSNILASALHDGNIAPSDWAPSGRSLPTGQAVLQSEDGRQRTEALVQYIQNKYTFVYNPRFAASWLKQYDGLTFGMLPADAQKRVEKIQLRMRIASTPFTLEEHCRYFESRQQSSVTTPGERLTATASLNWALPMYHRLRATMIMCNLSKPTQKRGEDVRDFIRIARTVLASDDELAQLGQDLIKWVDGGAGSELDQLIAWVSNHELAMPEDEADAVMSSALKDVFELSSTFIAPGGSGFKPTDKKLHYLCGPILRDPQRETIVAAMKTRPFTISPEFVKPGRNWEFINSPTLLEQVVVHAQLIKVPPLPAPRPDSQRLLVVGDNTGLITPEQFTVAAGSAAN